MKRCRYVAVALAALVPKIKEETVLRRVVPVLAWATLKEPDGEVREYSRRALFSVLDGLEETKRRQLRD